MENYPKQGQAYLTCKERQVAWKIALRITIANF